MLTNFTKKNVLEFKNTLHVKNKSDAVMIITAIALLIYTTLVAIGSDITYDEAWTYMHYALPNTPGFLDIDLANNHPLNSFLVYIFSFLLPYNELAIRLPNLIFLALYLILAIKISKKYPSFSLLTFVFLVLFWQLIPYYFSLGRGYGIATTLVLLFLTNFVKEGDNNIISGFYILLLASYAFVGLLPFVLSVALYYLIFEIKFKLLSFIRTYLIDILFLGLNFIFIAYYLTKISGEGKPLPDFGTNQLTFVASTVGYYLEEFIFFNNNFNHTTLLVISEVVLVLSILMFTKNIEESKVTFLTIVTFLIFYTLSKLTNKPFVTGRLLIPFIPIVAISLTETLTYVTGMIGIKKNYFKLISLILTALVALNYFGEIKIKNQELGFIKNTSINAKEQILGNLDIETSDWSPSILFYKERFFRSILRKNTPFQEILADGIKLYYHKDSKILLFEVEPPKKKHSRFYLYVYPEKIEDLPFERRKFGFDKLDFNWFGYKTETHDYILKKLPDYKIDSFKIGQKYKGKWPWSKTVILDSLQLNNQEKLFLDPDQRND